MVNARSVLLTAALAAGCAPGFANAGKVRSKVVASPAAARDCTPINGRYGCYGNPWCDTGSYRQEDIEYRERQRILRKKPIGHWRRG